jgi:hypothetical protein
MVDALELDEECRPLSLGVALGYSPGPFGGVAMLLLGGGV